MLIAGDISGIHQFVTNVAHVGGGQAKRLRARSFYVQALCDVAAVKILHALGIKDVGENHFLMSAAGHFVLRVDDEPSYSNVLREQERELNAWLLSELSAQIRLALAWSSEGATEMETFRDTRRKLNQATLRPWESVLTREGKWETGQLILPPLDTACTICKERTGEIIETDEDESKQRLVCRLCSNLKQLGRALTRARWMVVRTTNPAPSHSNASIPAFGLYVEVRDIMPSPSDALAIAPLDEAIPTASAGPFAGRLLSRPLARHVPSDKDHSTLDFQTIASQATGDAKLGILAADGDGMGEFWNSIFQNESDLLLYRSVSKSFDDYSAIEINQLIRGAVSSGQSQERWRFVYTVFSGGDDLLYIGPWDTMVDFAFEVRRRFVDRFATRGVTLSAGLGIVKPGWPIRRLGQIAEESLRMAKTTPAKGTATAKDQICALGDIWKWENHEEIVAEGRQWASWVRDGLLNRGWLQRIREFNEARPIEDGEHFRPRKATTTSAIMASPRLSYSIERLLLSSREIHNCVELKSRLQEVVSDFEKPNTTRARYLSASLYYAILSTRTAGAEASDELG